VKLIEETPQLFKPTDPPTREAVKRLFLRVLEHDTSKKVDEYPRWILNQGLVILCTRFDVCLEDIVDVIYRKQIKLLYPSTEAKGISLQAVVEAGTTEAVLKEVRESARA
jgi:hypothetical protein